MIKQIPESKILKLTLTLSNYPILSKKIRVSMRSELFRRGFIEPAALENEVEKKAVNTQYMEGLTDPINQEVEVVWTERKDCIRDYLTDFYFAHNLSFSRFEKIVEATINENSSGRSKRTIHHFINPELAPWYLLFAQGEKYANYPPELYEGVKHHLRQIVVTLIKSLVSDHLAFVRVARQSITIFDLKYIKEHKIGVGKIGGKAAGMLLAHKILTSPEVEDELEINQSIDIPETYFIGGDVYYEFKAINKFDYTTGLKYRSREEIEQEYPHIYNSYQSGRFPEEIVEQLRTLLKQIGKQPLIVRSSSLLEDNFGAAFAGKYDSYFLPNQGDVAENLSTLLKAVAQIYASVLKPDALLYRQRQGLEDYDERMAILIQKVQGEQHGKYFFPYVAGVGFSRNPFIWNKKLKQEEGFLRIVTGLGTRAVDRVDKDYPRMIGLSHPQLRPVNTTADIRKYSQHQLDLIDLEENSLKTVPIRDVLSNNFPNIQYLISVDEGDFIKPVFSLGTEIPSRKMILTFDNLLKNTDFAKLMKAILRKLERHYKCPVDIEFTIQVVPGYPKPDFKIFILQCRPLSNREWINVVVPDNIPLADQIFTAGYLVPQGVVDKIKYIIYVDPLKYSQLPSDIVRLELARIIGRLNKLLEGETFILMGPGRWGSSNIKLGVKVSYADIYNSRMLIEIAVPHNGVTPELSYGTHFFQDLVESNIYPLSLYPERSETIFDHNFIDGSTNLLASLLPKDCPYTDYIKVINIPQVSQGRFLRVVMNAEENKGMGYLKLY